MALPPNMHAGSTASPANATNFCPQINIANATEFELINPCKQSNFIMGSVVNGELTFIVENLPKTTPTTGCPGWWLFSQMMDHFLFVTTLTAVVGSWTYGDNLVAINQLTGGSNPLPLEEAAKLTATGKYASSWQFTNVVVASSTGRVGNYTQVRVLFGK